MWLVGASPASDEWPKIAKMPVPQNIQQVFVNNKEQSLTQ